jgi:hypothetical protein
MFVVVFILGGIVGFLIKDIITKSPYDQIKVLRSKGGIVSRFENILNLSEKQKKELKPILENHEKKIFDIAEKSREEIRETVEKFKDELKPYLSDDQIILLTEEFDFKIPLPPNPEAKAVFLREKLSLTDIQFESIKKIFIAEDEKIRSQMPKVSNENDINRKFEKIDQIIEETNRDILILLDDDQKAEFKKIENQSVKGFGF